MKVNMAYIQFLLLVVCHLIVLGSSAGVCPRLKNKFCSQLENLGYDKTFFPNLLGHIDQKEAKNGMKPYEALAKTGCSPYIQALICATFLPACPVWRDNPKKAQKPCRELCEKAREGCEETLINELGMEWPPELDCESLPADDPTRRNPTCTNYMPPRPASTTPMTSSPPMEMTTLAMETDAMTTEMVTDEAGYSASPSTSTEYVSTREPDGLPIIRKSPLNVAAMVGGIAEFSCLASGADEYKWKRIDGDFPREKVDLEESSKFGGAFLRLVDLGIEDDGIYACVASNENGYVTALVTLSLVVPPTIRVIESPQFVAEGGRLEIDCMGEGVPTPTIFWEKNDGGRVKSKGSEFKRTLVIKKADQSDAGLYFCVATNEAGHANITVEVKLEYSVEIINDLREQMIYENDTAFFVCRAIGSPPPKFTWQKIDGAFPDEARVVIETPRVNDTWDYPIYTSIMGIEPSYASDTGTYQCVASNDGGNITAVGDLIVIGYPDFIQKPEPETIATVGDYAEFQCIPSSAPPFEITWAREGDPDWPGDDSRVVMEEENSILRINDVMPEDSGVYICKLSNDLGEADASSYLEVEDNFSDDLAIVIRPKDTTTYVGRTVVLRCRVRGSPFPTVKWLFDNIPVDSGLFDDRFEQHGTDLVIRRVQLRDAGAYHCIASSVYGGRVIAEAVLTVLEGHDGMPSTAVIDEVETEFLTGTEFGDLDSTMATDIEFATDLPTDATTALVDAEMETGAAEIVTDVTPEEVEEEDTMLLRRTDITDPGVRGFFSGWVDILGQGAANDFCRVIQAGKDEQYTLACSLAGTEGEEEFNYVSSSSFDVGEPGTFYMKDENGDGRFDYCRCTVVDDKRYVWCTTAGENGFHGNENAEPGTDEYSFKAEGDKGSLKKCRKRLVDPFFGIPYMSS